MAGNNFESLFRSLRIHSNDNEDLRNIFDAVVAIYSQWEHQYNDRELQQICLSRMKDISQIYRHHLRFTQLRIDFADRFTQWAYMYLFMMRHVHIVHYALDVTVQERLMYVNPSGLPPAVCMIGGGPGSDILGLCVFLRKHGFTATLTGQVDVLDKCIGWNWSWETLQPLLPNNYRYGIPRVSYRQFDYTVNELSLTNQNIVSGAYIVTMIKSLSPVAAWLRTVQQSYRWSYRSDGRLRETIDKWHSVFSILKHMTAGAFLLYIDNQTGPQREILMETVRCFKFKVIFDRVLHNVRMPTEIFSPEARRLMNMMNFRPCTTAGTNEVILLRKLSM
ncbi:hypothetical protein BSL78_24694 [Apostichopus japonicus]|uniref:Uncharacterized protein n=1 Tax=Stichopus japonicus TaxID=307972 RepID=A0A2G8JRY1_STIJA|nr:hypothetical protein BSL78_24694 [Apostichopus japonicus]